ncbi:hypothetical protein C9374_002107 [Naegleria lovaniensis]|uniref:Uncharacterized protein n=1 Tax=Naegleria lovaniensis TaxID=51637 RepID=A0AA88KR67_NAELO|nr:uncharacterized protein C9374_002107 [Naegleria lovaniensis]KAG2387072.1 hypothetical protein C9374_002107 [Naegleria lovaniensis]
MHFSKGDHYKHKYPQNASSSSSSTLYFPPIPPLSVNHLPFPNDEPFPQQSFMARSPRRSNLPLIDTNPNRDNLLHSSIDNHLNQGHHPSFLFASSKTSLLQLNESLIMMENQPPSSSTSTFPNLVPPLSIHSTGEMNQHSDLNQQPPVSARSIRFNLDPIIHEEEESKKPHKKKPRENKPRVPSVSFPSNPITMPQDEDQFEIDPTQKERIARRPKTPRTPELALNSDYVSRDWTRGGEEESKESEQEKERRK